MDIVERLQKRNAPFGKLELLDAAAAELSTLRDERDVWKRRAMDYAAQLARDALEGGRFDPYAPDLHHRLKRLEDAVLELNPGLNWDIR
jgi:hypothetical protein